MPFRVFFQQIHPQYQFHPPNALNILWHDEVENHPLFQVVLSSLIVYGFWSVSHKISSLLRKYLRL